MSVVNFINKSGLDFKDISSEKQRQYVYSDFTITIKEPLKLNVSKNGHRLFDSAGNSYYVPNGYKFIIWQAKEGEAHFAL